MLGSYYLGLGRKMSDPNNGIKVYCTGINEESNSNQEHHFWLECRGRIFQMAFQVFKRLKLKETMGENDTFFVEL